MKKIILISLLLGLIPAVPASAQKKPELLLKFSAQGSLMRLVFEAEEPFLSKAKVSTSSSQIKIEFPEPFTITSQKNLPFAMEVKETSLLVTVRKEGQINFFRLASPSRLVFDMEKKEPEPEKQESAISQRVFVIDAGHGGYDFGITYGDVNEKDVCLDLAKELGAFLSRRGKRVFLTRRADQYLGIGDRVNFVNRKTPDVFISLHLSTTSDFTVYNPKFGDQSMDEVLNLYSLSSRQKRFLGKSKTLADAVKKALGNEFKIDIVSREMPVPVLNSVGTAAILIESPSPRFTAYDKQMKTRLVKAIINGIAAYGQ